MNIDSITKTAAIILADQVRYLESDGQSFIKLQTGEPDFDSYFGITEAAYAALNNGETHYTYSNGIPALRRAISDSLTLEGVAINQDCVLVTNGASGAISAVMAALLEYGDEVIIPEPNWPTVDSIVKINGGVPVKISLGELLESDVAHLLDRHATKRTRAIYINTPHNPTGTILPQQCLDEICNWAIERQIYIVADEVYRSLQYVEKKSSSLKLLESYKKYVFVDSFSKKYAMTGWRIGYCISSATVIERIAKAVQLSSTCIAPFVQLAAVYALTSDESQMYAMKMYLTYQHRRLKAMALCSELGLHVEPAEGAFYLFIKLPFGIDDLSFAKNLMYEHSVCVVP